jgi:hypothetical protein
VTAPAYTLSFRESLIFAMQLTAGLTPVLGIGAIVTAVLGLSRVRNQAREFTARPMRRRGL